MRAHGRTGECGVGDGASWPDVARSVGYRRGTASTRWPGPTPVVH